MDFIISLPILANWKDNNYNLILVIVDRLTKMVHYKPIKVTIKISGLAKVIINIVVRYHGVLESIMTN